MLNNFRPRTLALTTGLVGMLALGVVNLAFAQDSGPKDGPVAPVNPDRGLSDDEIRAKHRQNINRQIEKNDAFVLDWEKQAKDPRSLLRVQIIGDVDSVPLSVAEATAAADVIVRVEVQKTRFTSNNAVVEAKVVQSLKGPTRDRVSVTQVGGPRFDEPSGRAILTEAPWDPILLKGDTAILFLRDDPMTQGGYIVVPTQNYLVRADGLLTVPEESVLRQFDGKPPEDLLAAVAQVD